VPRLIESGIDPSQSAILAEGALGLFRQTPPQRLMRDAQAGAAHLTDADVHVFDASSERERCRTTDRTDRDDFAGLRKVGFQEVTTAVSISDEPRQSQSASCRNAWRQ